MPLALPSTAGRALFTAEGWAEIHDEKGNRIPPQYFYCQLNSKDAYKIRYDHGVTIEAPRNPNQASDRPKESNPVEETIERDLTSEELRELFGEDDEGNVLPDAELNAILGPAYADILGEKKVVKQPTAQKAVHGKASSPQAQNTKKKAPHASETSKKNAQKAKPATPSTKKNTPKPSGVSKPDAKRSTTNPKPNPQASTKPPKQKAVWNSALALCQQIEVYKGVKVTEYSGYDGIRHVVSEIELEDETVKVRFFRHADGRLELLVSGLLSDGRAEMGKKMHDVKDTSVLEFSRQVEFREDVVIEYTDDDALDVIGAARAEFDRERIMAVLYRHPDGLVEYVVSGPVLQAEVEEQKGADEVDAGVSRPTASTHGDSDIAKDGKRHEQKQKSQSKLIADDGPQVLANENHTPVPSSNIPSETSNEVATPKLKTGKRKRAPSDDDTSPAEYTAPDTKKARKDSPLTGKSRENRKNEIKSVGTEHPPAAPTKSNADAAPTSISKPAATAKAKQKRGNNDEDLKGDALSLSNEPPGHQNGQSKAGRPVATPKDSTRTTAPTPTPPSAPPPKGKRRRATDARDSDPDDDIPLVKRARTLATPRTSKRTTAQTVTTTSAPAAKGKKRKAADEDNEDPDDDFPLAKRARKEISTAAKNRLTNAARKDNTSKKNASAQTTEDVAPKQVDGREADGRATGKPNTATVTPGEAAFVADITKTLARGPSKAPARPTLLPPTKNVEETNEEPTTAPQASGASPPNTADAQIEKDGPATLPPAKNVEETNEEPTAAPPASGASQPTSADAQIEEDDPATSVQGKKRKRPVKKATGAARNGRSYVAAGPDPDRVRPVKQVTKRGREDDADEGGSAGPEGKRTTQS